jgi:hypothetical protein
MATNATVLIADISGYTDFVTATEIVHSTHIIGELLDKILKANEDQFSLAEVEGDALLLYREGGVVGRSDLTRHCIRLLKAFHGFLKVIERDRVCDCGACSTATGLDLKFVAHYGEVDHITIGPVRKPAGMSLIVAHRLLKNSVTESSYLLATCDLLESESSDTRPGSSDDDTDWCSAADEYAVIGTVPYEYVSLASVRDSVPDPPRRDLDVVPSENLLEVRIEAPLAKVYEALIDHEAKPMWVGGIEDVSVDSVIQRIGSTHLCRVNGAVLDFETAQAVIDAERRVLVERVAIRGADLELLSYVELIEINPALTRLLSGVGPATDAHVPPDVLADVMAQNEQDLHRFKRYVESLPA